MRRLWGLGVAVTAGAAALLIAGCGTPTDYSEIVTFTDEHGRVCTAAVVVDQEQNEGDDYEISSLDCDYPRRAGRRGPPATRPCRSGIRSNRRRPHPHRTEPGQQSRDDRPHQH